MEDIFSLCVITARSCLRYNRGMVKTYKDVLSPAQCESIIEKWKTTMISKIEHESRVCSGTVIAPPMAEDPELLELPVMIERYGQEYAKEMNLGPVQMEQVQIIHYEQDEGFFSRHIDGMGRKFSAILYLNDVEVGGETRFYGEFSYVVKPKPGKLVFFSSELEHEATKPKSGGKYIAVTWFK